MAEIKKVVLAYSGGLDTSIIIPWLKENYNDPEIIAVSGDVGQGTELDGLEEKAIKTGASKLYVEDLTDEMVDEVIVPSMMMGAKYEDYLLGTAFARPIIAKRLVEGGAQEIILILGPHHHRGDNHLIHHLVSEILHIELGGAGLDGLFLQAVQLGALAHVAGDGDDLRVVVILLQPGDDDGCIQTAGICQHYFFYLCHGSFPSKIPDQSYFGPLRIV